MRFGIDRLLDEPALREPLAGRRVALLAHPASVTRDLTHSLDALARCGDVQLTAAFGPQHGLRGDKQDNMVESPRLRRSGASAFRCSASTARCAGRRGDDGQRSTCCWSTCRTSAAASTPSSPPCGTCWRRPRQQARRCGCSIGPIPVGRPVEGLTLRPGWESFVGAGPLPMRHGLTLGRARALVRRDPAARRRLSGRSRWRAGSRTRRPATAGRWASAPGSTPAPTRPTCGWRGAYAGTVMLEGTTLSEGPRHHPAAGAVRRAGPRRRARCWRDAGSSRRSWLRGCRLRACWFEPTFHKHVGKLCAGVQIHVEDPSTTITSLQPWRLHGAGLQGAAAAARPTTRCGATFPTSTRAAGWRSTSSTAAHCCANGSTIPPRSRQTLRRLPRQMNRRGVRSAALFCCIPEFPGPDQYL